jgi:hypothetical protein
MYISRLRELKKESLPHKRFKIFLRSIILSRLEITDKADIAAIKEPTKGKKSYSGEYIKEMVKK